MSASSSSGMVAAEERDQEAYGRACSEIQHWRREHRADLLEYAAAQVAVLELAPWARPLLEEASVEALLDGGLPSIADEWRDPADALLYPIDVVHAMLIDKIEPAADWIAAWERLIDALDAVIESIAEIEK